MIVYLCTKFELVWLSCSWVIQETIQLQQTFEQFCPSLYSTLTSWWSCSTYYGCLLQTKAHIRNFWNVYSFADSCQLEGHVFHHSKIQAIESLTIKFFITLIRKNPFPRTWLCLSKSLEGALNVHFGLYRCNLDWLFSPSVASKWSCFI